MKRLLIIFGLFTSASYAQICSEAAPPYTGYNFNCTVDSSTGTTIYKYVKYNSGFTGVVVGATTDTASQFLGVASSTSNTFSVNIIRFGPALVAFDGATTAGHFFGLSSSSGGSFTDIGTTKTIGSVGQITQTIGSAGNALVDLFGPPPAVSGSSGLTSLNGNSTAAAVTRLCPPYLAGIADGVGNNTSGSLGQGTNTYYFGSASTAGYCETAGAATIGTLDGINKGIQVSMNFELDSAVISGTLILAACPAASFTAANVGSTTSPCSAPKTLYTTGSVSFNTASVILPTIYTFNILADPTTAGTVRVSLARPIAGANGSGTSIVVGGASLTAGQWYLYAQMTWASITTGTVACMGTVTTSAACIGLSSIIWGPTLN